MASVLVYSSGEVGLTHDTGRGHPERAERLAAVDEGIGMAAAVGDVQRSAGRRATREDLARVHDTAYLDRIEEFIAAGGVAVDADTRVSPGSWDAALLAAGSGLEAAEALTEAQRGTAFVAVRPPGHHACPAAAMGFCLVNNVAVTAASLADSGNRVLIVDWDVHHGNGTQDIFWDDARVMYVSTHQWPLYPGSGRHDETGGPHAPGLNLNVPLPPGATGDVARAALDELVAPEVDRFGPDWVLISAGFDAHRRDPLASFEWSAGDYADLTTTVASWAPVDGRVIAFLEGGYDLEALRDSTAALVGTLAGESLRPEAPSAGGPGGEQVARLVEWRRRLW
jgi:acetoin utilization deacetylase AcuC-like enzyme